MLHAAFELYIQNPTGMCNLLRKQNHANGCFCWWGNLGCQCDA